MRWERPFGDTSDDLGVFPALQVGLSSLTASQASPVRGRFDCRQCDSGDR